MAGPWLSAMVVNLSSFEVLAKVGRLISLMGAALGAALGAVLSGVLFGALYN